MKKILIVDDERGIRDMFAAHFLNRGYKVFSAATLSDACTIPSKESPDVFILKIIERKVEMLH